MPKVLMLGDSQTVGVGLKDDETIAARLQGLLTESLGHPVQVINAGIPGMATESELELLKHLGHQVKPKLIITALFADNDLAPCEGNDLYANSMGVASFRQSIRPPPAKFPFLSRRSHLYALMSRAWHSVRRKESKSSPTEPQNAAKLNEAWEKTDVLIGKIQKYSERELKASYVLLHLPGPNSYETNDHSAEARVASFKYPAALPFDALRSGVSTDLKQVYFQDGHFRPDSARVIASILHSRILQNPKTRAALSPSAKGSNSIIGKAD